MIEMNHVCKSFDDIHAVNDITLTIGEGSVFGLVGTNGAGKSTLFRMIAGIYPTQSGSITVDGNTAYNNTASKELFFFIADAPYYFNNATPKEMASYYSSIFPSFDMQSLNHYLDMFELAPDRKINTFSKGMKKQLSMLLGICAKTKYLLCDETFDGLDPVMRQSIKSLLAKEMTERHLTPVIASHNLRELEDICDHVGLLHKGGVLLSKDLDDMKCNIQKIQCVFSDEAEKQKALQQLDVLNCETRGSLYTITVRGTKDSILDLFSTVYTVFFEVLPLSLEEIFISETEVAGYDIKKLILN